jgi:hypothetical protein
MMRNNLLRLGLVLVMAGSGSAQDKAGVDLGTDSLFRERFGIFSGDQGEHRVVVSELVPTPEAMVFHGWAGPADLLFSEDRNKTLLHRFALHSGADQRLIVSDSDRVVVVSLNGSHDLNNCEVAFFSPTLEFISAVRIDIGWYAQVLNHRVCVLKDSSGFTLTISSDWGLLAARFVGGTLTSLNEWRSQDDHLFIPMETVSTNRGTMGYGTYGFQPCLFLYDGTKRLRFWLLPASLGNAVHGARVLASNGSKILVRGDKRLGLFDLDNDQWTEFQTDAGLDVGDLSLGTFDGRPCLVGGYEVHSAGFFLPLIVLLDYDHMENALPLALTIITDSGTSTEPFSGWVGPAAENTLVVSSGLSGNGLVLRGDTDSLLRSNVVGFVWNAKPVQAGPPTRLVSQTYDFDETPSQLQYTPGLDATAALDPDVPLALNTGVPVLNFTMDYPYVANENGVNVRDSPDVNGKVLFQLNRGNVVRRLQTTETIAQVGTDRAPWIQINSLGRKGWVFGRYLSPRVEFKL